MERVYVNLLYNDNPRQDLRHVLLPIIVVTHLAFILETILAVSNLEIIFLFGFKLRSCQN